MTYEQARHAFPTAREYNSHFTLACGASFTISELLLVMAERGQDTQHHLLARRLTLVGIPEKHHEPLQFWFRQGNMRELSVSLQRISDTLEQGVAQ